MFRENILLSNTQNGLSATLVGKIGTDLPDN